MSCFFHVCTVCIIMMWLQVDDMHALTIDSVFIRLYYTDRHWFASTCGKKICGLPLQSSSYFNGVLILDLSKLQIK